MGTSTTPQELVDKLRSLSLEFEHNHHPSVHTVADWALAQQECKFNGTLTKCLFLKDKKNQLYLVVALSDTTVDLKGLCKKLSLPSGTLRFGAEDLLLSTLGVVQGSVTPFAIINDREQKVKLLIDENLSRTDGVVCFHPLVNDQTITLSVQDLKKFIESCNRDYVIIQL